MVNNQPGLTYDHGIPFEILDSQPYTEQIEAEAPVGAITQINIEAIRQHEVELIELLADPSQWDEYHDAITHAFAHPTSRSDIGPDWMTDDWPDHLAPAKPIPGACDRCGATKHKSIPIHDGRSIRRDCANCGRTHGFSEWNPIQ